MVRCTRDARAFDRKTKAKVRRKNWDEKGGMIKSRAGGPADENKHIRVVRSRFRETIRRPASHQPRPQLLLLSSGAPLGPQAPAKTYVLRSILILVTLAAGPAPGEAGLRNSTAITVRGCQKLPGSLAA